MHARNFSAPGKRRVHGVRYYESSIKTGVLGERIGRTRVQADQIELLVLEALKLLLSDRTRVRPILVQANIFGSVLEDLSRYSPAAAMRLGKLSLRQLSVAVKALLSRVEVAEDCVRLVIPAFALAKFIGWDGVGYFRLTELELARATRLHVLVIPAAVIRHRGVSWLPVERNTSSACPNARLLRLINEARRAQELLFSERDKSLDQVARQAGKRTGSFSRLVRLNYLAPDIVAAIVDGTQPPSLTRRQLIECDLPIDWPLQRRLLGFRPRQEVSGAAAAVASPAIS